MRLYFAAAVGKNGEEGGEKALFKSGVRNRLLSFAVVKDGGMSGTAAADYWIESRSEAMKLYVAGNGKSNGSSQRDYDTGTRNRLLSYAFIEDWAKDEFQYWIENEPQSVSVFLDSGAFSAYTLGRRIDLGEYCDYVERHKAALAAYAVLDVIGDAKATLVNLHAMRARGLDPVAIYHVGSEKLDVLEAVLSDGAGYIALGGMASDRPTREELQSKLDPCWRILEKHWPIRVHGLGVMAQWALERYPFYSVDSSSAIMGAGMGRVVRFPLGYGDEAPATGLLEANGWKDDVRATCDGVVADGIGRVRKEGERSDSAHEGRRLRNIQAQLRMERYVTDLWAWRGVTWS